MEFPNRVGPAYGSITIIRKDPCPALGDIMGLDDDDKIIILSTGALNIKVKNIVRERVEC